jgi:periplasmic protein TonB
MPRDLFGDVTRPSISIGNRKWYTVPLSLFSHSFVVGAVVVVPLMATNVLPSPWQPVEAPYMPLVPPPPPPPPPIRNTPPPPQTVADVIPTAAPDGFAPEKPRPEPGFENTVSTPGLIAGDADPTVIGEPPPPAPVEQKPFRVGGVIRQPLKVRDVQPVYPPMAQAARVQGIVIIEATLGADGRVMNAKVLRSVPLLDNAALDAVRQWEFTPTTLNGVAVPVVMTVTVSFVLSR